MTDDPNKTAPQDAQWVNLSQEHEVKYWTQRFGVSRERLQQAVGRVGSRVKAVERELNVTKTSADAH